VYVFGLGRRPAPAGAPPDASGLRSDHVVEGRGARPVWALQLQVLRELAQHAGHADILREQILASRETTTSNPKDPR